MRRFLIPAFFVIHAETEEAADERAGNLQGELLTRLRDNKSKDTLLLDEKLPTKEVQIHPEETEFPHTYDIDGAERI